MKRTIFGLRTHAWASLFINACIYFFAFCVKNQLFSTPLLLWCVAMLVISILYIANRVSLDMLVNDTGILSLLFLYAGVLALSIMAIYQAFVHLSILSAILIIISVIIEGLSIFVIIYRYKVRNWIIRFFKKRKKDKDCV